MPNVDYSFMQTGFNNIQGVEQLSNSEKATLLSTIVVYFEEAIKIAEGYVIYEAREEITAYDIVLALKVQALDHVDMWDKEETKQRVSEGYDDIYNDLTTPNVNGDDDDGSDDHDNDDGGDDGDGDDDDDGGGNKLEEDTYNLIKSAHDRWSEWEPTDQINIILKSSIDKTEERINNKDIDED